MSRGEPLIQDEDFTLHVGDALEVLRTLPSESVHMCVTSPPYWGLRDYGTGTWEGGDADCDHKQGRDGSGRADGIVDERAQRNRDGAAALTRQVCRCGAVRVDNQLGLEPTPEAYVTRMVEVFREVRRVLRKDGTCWLNIGDSYNGSGLSGGKASIEGTFSFRGKQVSGSIAVADLKPKDLVGIPWRLAFALQADGWYLRSDIIWSKPNPMPESVTDRPTKAHEYLFLLSKSPRYFYDADAIREPHLQDGRGVTTIAKQGAGVTTHTNYANREGGERWPNGGRNKRTIWEIATEPFAAAHFATFPQALVEPCILAGTSERGCCPVCGAPWERETEVERPAEQTRRQAHLVRAQGEGSPNGMGGTGSTTFGTSGPKVTTIGWQPSCACHVGDAAFHHYNPIPCTVLDPFLGSGTTALVARRLGRRTIGTELSPEYAELAARRLQQLSLLA